MLAPENPPGSGRECDVPLSEIRHNDLSPPKIPSFQPTFPDGGLRAWLVVLGGFCCLFVSFGWINCIGVFQTYYETNLLSSYSSSTVAWISSLETFMMFGGGFGIGKLIDNYGVRYVLLIGSFLHVCGLMLASISTEYYQILLSQGICSPIGASAVFFCAMTSVSSWFQKRRPLAFGIMTSGSSLGGIIFPIMVNRLANQVGFGWAMRVSAFLNLFLLVIANLTVRSQFPPHPKPLHVQEFIRPFKDLSFRLTSLGGFFFFMGLFIPFNFISLQAEHLKMSTSLGGYLIPILNAASLPGRIIAGGMAVRIGNFNMTIIVTLVSGILVLALWLPSKGNAEIIVFAALYGFVSGAFVSLAPSVIAQISDVREIGVRNGCFFAVISIATLVGNPIGGALVSRQNGAFSGLQIFSGVTMLIGASVFVAARLCQSTHARIKI